MIWRSFTKEVFWIQTQIVSVDILEKNKSIEEGIVLPDWNKGDYNTFQGICDMSTTQLDNNRLFQSEIWKDIPDKGFRMANTDLQPLKRQGFMFRWGTNFAGPLSTTKRGNSYDGDGVHRTLYQMGRIDRVTIKIFGSCSACIFWNVLCRYGVPAVVFNRPEYGVPRTIPNSIG